MGYTLDYREEESLSDLQTGIKLDLNKLFITK